MSTPLVFPEDLNTYLGVAVGTIDTARASQILGLAQQLCESVVTPLPVGSEGTVLDVAARAFSNPTNVQSEGAGTFTAAYGSVAGGLWLTRQNKATLRRLAGSGGAFTIDTLPVTAGQNLPWWDVNSFPLGYDGQGPVY